MDRKDLMEIKKNSHYLTDLIRQALLKPAAGTIRCLFQVLAFFYFIIRASEGAEPAFTVYLISEPGMILAVSAAVTLTDFFIRKDTDTVRQLFKQFLLNIFYMNLVITVYAKSVRAVCFAALSVGEKSRPDMAALNILTAFAIFAAVQAAYLAWKKKINK